MHVLRTVLTVVPALAALWVLPGCSEKVEPAAPGKPSNPGLQRQQGFFADLRIGSALGAFVELEQVLTRIEDQLGSYLLTKIDVKLPPKKEGRYLSFTVVLRSDEASSFREKGSVLLDAITAAARSSDSSLAGVNKRQTGEKQTFSEGSEGYVFNVRIDLKPEDDYPVFVHENAVEDQQRLQQASATHPELYFEQQIRKAALTQGGVALSQSDFQIFSKPDQSARRGKAVDSLVSITWKKGGREVVSLRRDFILAVLFGCESPGSTWKLRELSMRRDGAAARGKAPPLELSDEWEVRQMTFARRRHRRTN